MDARFYIYAGLMTGVALMLSYSIAGAGDGYESVSLGGLSENASFFTRDYAERQRIGRFEKEVADKIEKRAAVEEALVSESQPPRAHFYKSMAYGFLYNSNLFNERIDPKDDITHVYAPRVGVSLGRQGVTRAFVNAFYDLTYTDYVENQKMSHFNHNITTGMGYDFGRLSVNIQNQLVPNTAVATGDRDDLATAESQRVITYADNASILLRYALSPKTTLSHTYGYSIFYFPAASNRKNPNAFNNSVQEHSLAPGIQYQLTEKTGIQADYRFSTSDYFEGADKASKSHSLTAGFTHDFSATTFSTFKAGYKIIDYNQPAFPQLKGYLYNGSIAHRLTQKLSMTISAGHDVSENFDQENLLSALGVNQSLSDVYSTSLSWRPTQTMSLTLFGTASYREREGQSAYVDPDNPTLTFTRADEQQMYRWGAAWQWKPRDRFSYFASYEFLNNNGSFKNTEYDSQRVLGSATCIF